VNAWTPARRQARSIAFRAPLFVAYGNTRRSGVRSLRCRAKGSAALIERAAAGRGICPGALTLGTDNGSAFTARAFKLALSGLGITHRRGGYRDPESLGFIESWFAK
jgi:transposase InsO family protein